LLLASWRGGDPGPSQRDVARIDTHDKPPGVDRVRCHRRAIEVARCQGADHL